MIQPLKRPPEPQGTIEEQLEDIRNYLNILYRRVMTDGDEAVMIARQLYQSITEGNNPELANLFANTLTAKKIVVTDDLTDGTTVISGDNIKTGTIDADRLDVNEIISDGNIVVKSNLTDGVTQISGDNITTGQVAAGNIDVAGVITAGGIIVSNDLTDGSTSISGDNIRTGTIIADYLDIDGISAVDVDITGTLTAVQGAIGLLQVINNGLSFSSPQYGGSFRLSIANPDTIPEINFFVGRSDMGASMEITTNQGIPEGKLNEMQIRRASDAYNYHMLEDIIDDIDSRLSTIETMLGI